MKLFRYDLKDATEETLEKVLIGEFASSDLAIAHICRRRPQTAMLSIIPTGADGILDETMWVLECRPAN
ncbi:hypothetical protein [Singulisphaera acidiphila]|uniref:Uncharacterized protein n=1 Tax=Singulisphaera acidiphila (strain ATCC BAA-1392 / DSM 18658 / VKM B-2454 / MOB10) TaxID=886293 RepID=L0DTL4_SINAD|nr:hypothetical protein [Singulisphaera acidiphila]AGA31711.1 hypothetical protein Sinac_7683 [Singulisphaera acidiphila DSM 18658]